MTFKVKVGAAAAIFLLPMHSSALTYGMYDVAGFNSSSDASNPQGVWFNSFLQDADGAALSFPNWTWNVFEGIFDYRTDGSATFTARAVNIETPTLGLDVTVELQENSSIVTSGYCQYEGGVQPCDGSGAAAAQEISEWAYFDFLSGAMIGSGGLSGVELSLSDFTLGIHPPQAGVGGNARVRNELGLSTWFGWESVGSVPADSNFSISSSNSNGTHGDINVVLAPIEAPLPSSVLLLAAGLAGLSAARRLKRAKA